MHVIYGQLHWVPLTRNQAFSRKAFTDVYTAGGSIKEGTTCTLVRLQELRMEVLCLLDAHASLVAVARHAAGEGLVALCTYWCATRPSEDHDLRPRTQARVNVPLCVARLVNRRAPTFALKASADTAPHTTGHRKCTRDCPLRCGCYRANSVTGH